jgi:HK97 family phage major capsid protein
VVMEVVPNVATTAALDIMEAVQLHTSNMTRFANARASTSQRLNSLTEILDAMSSITHAPDSDDYPHEVTKATRESAAGFGNERFRSVRLPLNWVMRDLNVGSAAAGGNLVGAPRANHTESLRGFSNVADAGAQTVVFPEGSNPIGVPGVSAPPVAGWRTDEFAVFPESEMAFNLANVAPKSAGFWFRVSRRLLKMAGPAGDALIRTEVMKALGRAIDAAALQGSGTAGQPTGLASLAGVFNQPGASLSWAGVQAMLEAVRLAGGRDRSIAFIGAPGVARALSTRERAAGSGFVWDGGLIAGRPADVSLECPAGGLFVGDFSRMVVAIHGGLQLTVDAVPATNGSVRMVAAVDADIVVQFPAVFARATSVT